MRAIVMEDFGGPEVLVERKVPDLEPGPGEVLVQVHAVFVAAGRDAGTRSGLHPVFSRRVTLPHILGGEHAGLVAAVGSGVARDLVGARVAVSAQVQCGVCAACRDSRPWDCSAVDSIGIGRQGSYAEYTVVPAGNVHQLPDEVSFAQAAILSANGPLALEELKVARTEPDERVLVPGAPGSVGSVIVALAVSRGAEVIALTRNANAATVLEQIGADHVLDPGEPKLADALLEVAPGGVDVVIDNVAAADLWQRYWPAVARRGRIVFAGRAGGDRTPLPVDVMELYRRRATLTGLTIGDPRQAHSFWAEMRTRPLAIPSSLIWEFPLEQAAIAHEQIERGGKVGHVVLSVAL